MDVIRETVYGHFAGEDTFAVDAAEQWSINMVRWLKEKYPDEVEIVVENKDGTLNARMPKEWMKIRPTVKMNLTDEQRQARRERLLSAKSSKENR